MVLQTSSVVSIYLSRMTSIGMIGLPGAGIYELLEMGQPEHTTSEHVELAKVLVRPDAARFTTGMLLSCCWNVDSQVT